MPKPVITAKVNLTEEECCKRYAKCPCGFNVFKDGTLVAYGTDYDALVAIKRLLGY